MKPRALFKSDESRRILLEAYDEHLARWPVAAETREVATRHGSTFVVSSGNPDAPPVVLLHGASSNALMWVADGAELSLTHRVHAVDVIGEPGRSSPTHTVRWSRLLRLAR